MIDKKCVFDSIHSSLKNQIVYSNEQAIVVKGDSLQTLRSIPSNSISLILTDPPYHSTKKRNIYGDTSFAEDQHFLEWMGKYISEWRRVLKQNGSIFCFCSSEMSGRLEGLFSQNFNVLSHIVWTKPNDPGFDGWKGKMKKESLRQWYAHSERIIFAEPAMIGNLHRSPFAEFLKKARKASGLSMHQLTAETGAYGKVNHGGAVSNWEAGRNTPSKEQYQKISDAILATGKVGWMPVYEDIVRVFKMDGTKEFTDVWNFPSVRPYKGKHPAEKPAVLLEHAIEATTFAEDIVLDCFAGSGSTSLAALKLGRRSISIEIEPQWASLISDRLSLLANSLEIKQKIEKTDLMKKPVKKGSPQMLLDGMIGN